MPSTAYSSLKKIKETTSTDCVGDSLRQNKLDAKFRSASSGLQQVVFLGHIVSADGIIIDPSKVEAITKWPRPTTVTELMKKRVRSFVVTDERQRVFDAIETEIGDLL
ncbi:hypothetical protein Tco_0459466 [Tanacetum coccineum]